MKQEANHLLLFMVDFFNSWTNASTEASVQSAWSNAKDRQLRCLGRSSGTSTAKYRGLRWLQNIDDFIGLEDCQVCRLQNIDDFVGCKISTTSSAAKVVGVGYKKMDNFVGERSSGMRWSTKAGGRLGRWTKLRQWLVVGKDLMG